MVFEKYEKLALSQDMSILQWNKSSVKNGFIQSNNDLLHMGKIAHSY